jgi:hypothetical protein
VKGKAILLSSDSYAALHTIMTCFWPELRRRRFEIKLVFYTKPKPVWAFLPRYFINIFNCCT